MDALKKYLDQKDIPRDVRETIRKEFRERKKVEDALRKHIQMIDFADDTIMIRDLKDRVTYWNQGAERLYGWKKEEVLGQHVHTFLNTKFPVSSREAVKICLKTGYWEGELTHTRRGGSQVVVASRWTLQRDDKGRPIAFLEINNNVTELKKAEGALLEARNQLEMRVEKRTRELKEMNKELQRVIHERKRLEKEILEISEMEQRRIGQDLHDGLSQHLTGIAFMAKVLEKKTVAQRGSEASQVKKIVELVNEAVTETRGLARGLYPVELESTGLMSALQELAANTREMYQISCLFKCDRPILIHNHVIATHLYRIAQEAVNNAVKHGQPRRVSILLERIEKNIMMKIRDDGLGIPRGPFKFKGMGLRIMRYRTEMIQATLKIERGEEGGTLVTCILPYSRALLRNLNGRGS